MQKFLSGKPLLSGIVVSSLLILSGCVHWGERAIDIAPSGYTAEGTREIEVIDLKEAKEETSAYSVIPPELPELELSLEACRAMTLENNLDLRVQLINPTIAAERVNQEEARFEATFSGMIQYSKTDSPTYTALEASKQDTAYGNFGVTMPLRSGGELKVDLLDYKRKTNNAFSFLNPSNTASLSASISHPLLKNAGNRVNTYQIRAAEYNRQLADTQTKMEATRIIANVDRAYWQLYASRRLLDVRRQQYDLAKALFEQTERLVEVGITPRIELIRTRAGMADKLEAIIRAENDVRNMERDLKGRLNRPGLGMETKTILVPTTTPDPVRYDLDREKLVAGALENRMEMLELEIQLISDEDRIAYQKNQLLPLITMEYKYNLNGLGDTRGGAYDQLYKHDYSDHQFGLRFSVPLGNESAESSLRQARYERAKRLASRDSRKAQIKYEVLNQIDKLEASWQRILASRQSTILSDEQYQAEKRQYELGLATSTDVLEAQTSLADAQRVEILALTEYQIAVIDLAYATGTLLGAAKVELEPIVPQD